MTDRLRTAAEAVPCVRRLGRAQAALDDLMARVGVDGLTHAFADAGFLADLDQHAADVTRAIRQAGRRLTADSLVSYADSVLAAARRMGLAVPEPGEATAPLLEWAQAPWHLRRLVAVCAIAERAGWL